MPEQNEDSIIQKALGLATATLFLVVGWLFSLIVDIGRTLRLDLYDVVKETERQKAQIEHLMDETKDIAKCKFDESKSSGKK